MPQRTNVTKALRFLHTHPAIPAKGMKYIAGKLQETEEEPGETQKYLKTAYQYLEKRRTPNKRMLRNIKRLSGALNASD
jgi:nitrate/TMAO reductase-like tetraheme cytochrome c subunit